MNILASANSPAPTPQQAGLLKDILSGQLPTQAQYIDLLQTIGLAQAIMLVIVGAVFLLYGWKLFKALVIVDAAALGVFLGNEVGLLMGGTMPRIIAAVAGGLLLAVLAWPLMKYAVSLIGGLAGSVLGYGLWGYAAVVLDKPNMNQYPWVGALIGLAVLGLLAFIIFRFTIMLFTSFQGAFMIVSGSLAILLKINYTQAGTLETLRNIHVLPLLIGVPALIGFILQVTMTGGCKHGGSDHEKPKSD